MLVNSRVRAGDWPDIARWARPGAPRQYASYFSRTVEVSAMNNFGLVTARSKRRRSRAARSLHARRRIARVDIDASQSMRLQKKAYNAMPAFIPTIIDIKMPTGYIVKAAQPLRLASERDERSTTRRAITALLAPRAWRMFTIWRAFSAECFRGCFRKEASTGRFDCYQRDAQLTARR